MAVSKETTLQKIASIYSFVRSRSFNKTFNGFTFDDFLNEEKDKIKGTGIRMSKEKRLDKLNEDIEKVSSQIEENE